ncbi:MarR family winged helix-turn-helix transcriptional regulator [Herbidospora cretacea]|uniref:MarR family winged helix-turn-helix transcriptional regulator n=1 Tax=Herbidospora cretacea TaxID=28444 RepID=UPI000A8FE717|nr:MarR family transcriptional regulator [Herbidospora cretacea]
MPSRDLTLVFTALAAACDERVRARMAEAGHPEVRSVHGYVFQHLLTGPVRITDLAGLLGMTPQGASKVAAEMERIGYVTRRVSGEDQRVRTLELTDRGRAAIEAGRAAREAVTRELLAALPDPEPFLDALTTLSDQTGALRDLMARRLRP